MPAARMAQMIFFIGAPVGADLRALRSRRLISPGRTEKNHFHLIMRWARKLAQPLGHHVPRPPPLFPPRARQARSTRCRCRWQGPYPASWLPPTASARPALRLKGRAVGTGHKLRAQALRGRCVQSFCPVPERAAGAHAARTPLLSPSKRHLTPRRNDITVRRGRRAGPTVLQPSVG